MTDLTTGDDPEEDSTEEIFEELHTIDDLLNALDENLGKLADNINETVHLVVGNDFNANSVHLTFPIQIPNSLWSDIFMGEVQAAISGGRPRDDIFKEVNWIFPGLGDQMAEMDDDELSTLALGFNQVAEHNVDYSQTLKALDGYQKLKQMADLLGLSGNMSLVQVTEGFSTFGIALSTKDMSPILLKFSPPSDDSTYVM